MYSLTQIARLAQEARAIDEDDWSSDRQIDAENFFFDCVEAVLPPATMKTLNTYCLKATSDEAIDEALLLVSRYFFEQH